ncbi:unnamed protein product [Durusdinium trenchii]|uniref:Uncharacterized protein n=1 Tax=Durusdinium trenchii TaxID=1381693 RepID=A0ABP0PBE2_9DINO
MMAPPKMKSESPNLAAVAPVEIIEEAPKEASAPVIAKPPETSLTPFKDYYVSHVRALHPTDMQNLYAKFPSQPTPPGPSVLRAAEGPTTETTPCVSAEDARPVLWGFHHRPSVGTWLRPAHGPPGAARAGPRSLLVRRKSSVEKMDPEERPGVNGGMDFN